MTSVIFLTKVTTPVIGWIAELLGLIMNFLHTTLCINNIGWCIIIFTAIVNIIMLPLTIKQQKSSKLMSVMQPEIQAIQKKYQGKNDQVSQQKMQAETQAVYEKYGTSMFGGCGQLLIQFPILIALYQVIYHIPGYVPAIKAVIEPSAKALMEQPGFPADVESIVTALKMTAKNIDFTQVDHVVDFVYKLSPTQWDTVKATFGNIASVLEVTRVALKPMNSFLGIDLATAPWQGFKPNWSWLIPALAGASQWLSSKLLMANQPKQEGSAAASMNMMNNIMPLMSVFFCFTLPAGVGIYWIASAVCRTIIQVFINNMYKNIDVDELVKQNLEKVNKKRAKKGLPPKTIDKKAIAQAEREEKLRQAEEEKKAIQKEKSDKQVVDSTKYYNLNAKPGSLASKANMVAMYNQRELDKRRGKKKENEDGDNSNS